MAVGPDAVGIDVRGWNPRDHATLVDGVWVGAAASPAVDYPESGHDVIARVEQTSYWYEHRARTVDLLLERHVGRPATLWDVGAGTGAMSARLAELGHHVVTVEPEPVGARLAAARGCTDVICSSLEGLDLPARSLPALGLFDVVEHLADPTSLVNEARRVLVHGGVLVVTVPAYQWLWSQEDDVSGHHRRYTKRTLAQLLTGSGLRVLSIGYCFAALVAPAFLVRALPYRLGRRRDDTELMDSAGQALSPSGPVSAAMHRVCRWERALGSSRGMPFGLSVFGVATTEVGEATSPRGARSRP